MTTTDDRPTTTGRMLRIDSFSVYDTDWPKHAASTPATAFDSSGDLCMQLRLGKVTGSNDISGGAVAVLLDVDGGHHSQVVVDSRGGATDEETMAAAMAQLTRVLEQLRRLYGRGSA